MKKLSVQILVIVTAILSSCTLYMDEPEKDIQTLRTEEGYTDAETIELPNGEGSLTYKYNKNTIAITDEVEEYVIRVEDDSIVWFSAATPDYYLPKPGEMMTCSYREKFPNGFCHRCTELKDVDGLKRALFTPCGIFEAFDEFKTTVEDGEYVLPEGATLLSEEETDSMMNANDYDEEELAAAPIHHWRAPMNRAFKKKIKSVRIPLNIQAQLSSPLGIVDGYAKITGEISSGLSVLIDIDKKEEKFVIESGPFGQLSITVEAAVSAGINIESPIAIPILGVRADLKVVAINVGLTASPFLYARRQLKDVIKLTLGYEASTKYTKIGWDSKEAMTVSCTTRKKSGKPIFEFESKPAQTDGLTLYIQGGVDFQVGLGGKVAGTGAEAAIGLKLYGELNQTLDKGQFESTADFKKKNANFPTYALAYAKGMLSLFDGDLPLEAQYGPIECQVLKIPFFPVFEKGAIYCSRLSPKTYKMEGKIKDIGLLGLLWDYLPKMRIYDTENKNKLVKTFTMKWKKGTDLKEFSCEEKCNDIEFNHIYMGQIVMDSGDGFIVPLQDLPFCTNVPDMEITKLDLVQSLTAKNGTPEELANPSCIARHPTTGQMGWVKNGKVYNYRYKMNVSLKIGGIVSFYKWGIHMEDKWAKDTRFETTDMRYSNPTVRMTWYSSASEVWLGFTPFGYIIDTDGNKAKDSKMYEPWSGTAKYSTALDKQFGYQAWELSGGNAQFEKVPKKKQLEPVSVQELDFNPEEDYVEIEGIY